MKKILTLAAFLIGFASIGSAQTKTKAVQTVTIKTPTVQCESCKKRIESYMVREDGIQKINVDFKKKITKVTFVSDRTNIENIKTAIANVGYDADDVTANEPGTSRAPAATASASL